MNIQKECALFSESCILTIQNFSLLSQNISSLRIFFSLVYLFRQNFSLLKVFKRTRFSRIRFSGGMFWVIEILKGLIFYKILSKSCISSTSFWQFQHFEMDLVICILEKREISCFIVWLDLWQINVHIWVVLSIWNSQKSSFSTKLDQNLVFHRHLFDSFNILKWILQFVFWKKKTEILSL